MKTRQQIESIARSKKKMRTTLILLGVFVILLAGAIIASVIIKNKMSGSGSTGSSTTPPEIIEGEDIYRNNAIAYPLVDDKNITRITVNNSTLKDGYFTLYRSEAVDNDFLFAYMEDGEIKVYYPSICDEDSSFEYSDLYAFETNDGYGTIHRITYLTSALETAYFGERIPLSADEAERTEQLKEYGFDENTTTITFDYKDAGGATHSRKIVIGDKLVTGAGYYFMIDDRPYVYSSMSSYYEYAMRGFYSYVKTSIIAAGLEQDSTLEPIYTPEFTHWVTELCDTAGSLVPEKSEVIVSANLFVPIDPAKYLDDPSGYAEFINGYDYSGEAEMTIDLSSSSVDKVIKGAVVGKGIGKYYDIKDTAAERDDAIIFTIISDADQAHSLALDGKDSVKYSYKIVEIESIIGDGDDITKAGTPVGENNLIKVAYYCSIDGKSQGPMLAHAVIDLTSTTLPTDAVSALRASSIGKLSTPIELEIGYDRTNAHTVNYTARITQIIEIENQEGKAVKEIAEDSIVSFRYQLIIDGVLDDEEYIGIVDLKKPEDEFETKLKEMIIGKTTSYVTLTLEIGPQYFEVFKSFSTYEISEIKYFITKKEIVSFSFLSYSERDPFYGDSIYENKTDDYLLYGLSYNACYQILQMVGGVTDNTSTSSGLSGTEVVSVGITPEKLYELGLYKHRLYFELPRNLVAIDSGDDETLDDYTYYEKLGFTLYIGDIQDDGTRIIASDLYDIIVKADAATFFFLEESFVDLWARKNMLMTDVEFMQEIKIEFALDDFVGSYELDIIHQLSYITESGLQIGGNPPESYSDTFDRIKVNVTPTGDCTPNLLTQLIKENNRNYYSLEELYEYTVKDEDKLYQYFPDTLGTTYFKEFILSMFYVDFEDDVDKAEQDFAVEQCKMLMKFSIKIDTDKDGDDTDENYYTYEFYRTADRRVVVRLYEEDANGNMLQSKAVSDFYISTYGFKKIVNNFIHLMNGEEFDLESGYDF